MVRQSTASWKPVPSAAPRRSPTTICKRGTVRVSPLRQPSVPAFIFHPEQRLVASRPAGAMLQRRGIATLRVAAVSSVRRRPRPIRPPHTLHRLWEGREGDRGCGIARSALLATTTIDCRRHVSQLPRRIIHRILRAVCCTGSSDISESGGEAEGCKIRCNEGFRHRLQLHTLRFGRLIA